LPAVMSLSLTPLGLLCKDALSGPACASRFLAFVSACALSHRVGAKLPSVYNSSSKPALYNTVFPLTFHRIPSSLHARETTERTKLYLSPVTALFLDNIYSVILLPDSCCNPKWSTGLLPDQTSPLHFETLISCGSHDEENLGTRAMLVTLPSIRLTLALSILSRHLAVGAALHSAPTMTEIPDFELMKNAEEALIP